ncbi:hypothetical protein NEF87_002762 [Candidatus Lokiarchaeum ossiferum]|uniref:Zinc ribbon domain-containing protein n=1 Tax=Candidatus Lokiarchaeum ossiferum TaxID=2951803 RepID=A0ABY6HVT9_9ARCH|nr:hypothetical protein NEF87_002762 [Candidatus Lokiarchaeum sp. B-35]
MKPIKKIWGIAFLVLGIASGIPLGECEVTEVPLIADTFISISSSSGTDVIANYGLSEYLYIGDGFNGVSITALRFGFSGISTQDLKFSFSAKCTVYGDHTRKVKVFQIQDVSWDEINVTGIENPWDLVDLWTANETQANLTSLVVGGSTDSLEFNFTTAFRGELTLILCTDPLDTSWITLNAKENEYSWMSPASITYEASASTSTTSSSSPNGSSDDDFSWSVLLVPAVIIGGVVLIVKLGKKKTVSAPKARNFPSSPTAATYSSKTCIHCGKFLEGTSRFCKYCGKES